ncbi:MAG: magnesium chelatase subunit D [Pseudomonadota bacterium]
MTDTGPDNGVAEAAHWSRALAALSVFCVDPSGLGGVWIRSPVGPVRDAWCHRLAAILPDGAPRRITPMIDDAALFGGLDLAATLAKGRPVRTRGLVDNKADTRTLLLAMAERTSPGLAARLAGAIDGDNTLAVVALDEGIERDERLPASLRDRLAFHIDLTDVPPKAADDVTPVPTRNEIVTARRRLKQVDTAADDLEALTRLAAALAVPGLRAPYLALRAARAHAALFGRTALEADDLQIAADLVLAPRLTALPESEMEEETSPPEPDSPPPDPEPNQDPEIDEDESDRLTEQRLPEEILLQAIAASLPPGLLDRLRAAAGRSRSANQSGAGRKRLGTMRGRRLPSRRSNRPAMRPIDVVETLKAAAPWQAVRRRLAPESEAPVLFHRDDIRLKRFQEQSARLVIFVVDASGSTALTRLAEAKGAIELLLSEAYSRRDQIALVAFRGTGAQVLLPPTGALVQAKRRLSALPGGGATPLAAGLKAAFALAETAAARGTTPSLAILTDGKANIRIDGTPDRPGASNDAKELGRLIRAYNIPSMVIDTAVRPQAPASELAREMGAHYLPLPQGRADALTDAVDATLRRPA